MATQNGIYETSSGDLLRASTGPLVAGAGETLRSDAPRPAKVRGDADETNMTRWNGSAWIEVAQPATIINPSRVAIGTTTQRDATTPFEGALWCNTTTNQLEQYESAAWSAVGGAGGATLQFIETLTASASATLDFEGLDPGYYFMQFEGVLPVVNNDNLLLRFGTGATPTYETTLYGYNIHAMHSVSHILTFASDTAETSIRLVNSVDESTMFGIIGSLDLSLPTAADARQPQVRGTFGHIEHGNQVYQTNSYGKRNANTVITALRLFFAAGNITSGSVHLYKMLRA